MEFPLKGNWALNGFSMFKYIFRFSLYRIILCVSKYTLVHLMLEKKKLFVKIVNAELLILVEIYS